MRTVSESKHMPFQAAWVVDHHWSAPHGKPFWKWANALMAHDARNLKAAPSSSAFSSATAMRGLSHGRGGIVAGNAGVGWAELVGNEEEGEKEEGVEGPRGELIITRLHSFKTHMPHRWQCSNAG